MKKLLISLAFLPFALAIIFAAKTYWAKLWPDQTQHIVSDINSPNRTNTSERTIQLALLLDVSGSMDGLIEQAKAKMLGAKAEVEFGVARLKRLQQLR